MEAITNLISNIGGYLTNSPAGGFSGGANWGNIGKVLGVAGLGDQFITNWLGQRKQNDYINQQLKYQKNPQLAQNEITRMTQPLDQNLVAAVSNQVQGNLGSQGLAESPNIMASVMAQALAPYNQQNMQQASQLWQSIHGQPPPMPGQANMNPLFAMLIRGFQNSNREGSPGTGTLGGLDNIFFPTTTPADSSGAGDLFNWGLTPGQATA
jgi:hypothetical protein